MTDEMDLRNVDDALEEARLAWAKWRSAWGDVQSAMEQAGMSTNRIEAYRVGSGYDEGGGQSMEGWMDEVQQKVDEAAMTEEEKAQAEDDREYLRRQGGVAFFRS